MKHKLLYKFWLRVGMIVAVMTTALAGTAGATVYKSYIDGVQEAITTISATNVSSGTVGSVTWTGTDCTYSSNRVNIAANGSIKFVADDGYVITKIVIVSGSSSSYYGTWTSSPSVTPTSSNGTTTFEGLSSKEVTVTTSTAFRCTSASNITIYLASSGGSNPTCATPTFSPAAGAYTSAQNVTLSCETSGATIYYTTNGNDPTTSSSVYSSAISVSTTTTIKAMAVKANYDNSSVASATYTIVEPLTTMDAIFAAATSAGSTATPIAITFNNWVVTGVKDKTAYVSDGTKGFIVFQSGHGFAVGNVLSGTAVCKVQLYNGSSEITELTSTTTGLTITTGGIVTPVTNISIADLSGVNTGAVFSYENLAYDGTNLSDGINTIKPYTTLYSGTFVSGKNYNVTGVYLQFNDTKEILPRSADDIEELGSGPIVYNNISDITAVNTAYRVQGTVVATNARGLVIGDGTGYVYYYKNAEVSQSVGDMISIYGNTGTYGQILQFTNSATVEEATTSNYNNTPAATAITTIPDYTTGYHLSTYLQFEGQLTKSNSNYFITLGDDQIQISYPTTDQGTALNALAGKQVLVKGYFSGINSSSKFTVMLESVEEIVVPVINASNVTLEYDATSGEIAYAIDNPTTGTSLNATTTADWISNIVITTEKVTFTTTANEGNEDRAATITLSYEGAESVTVTVTQGHFVVDYAELPFEFDSGKADIVNTAGLTQSGLGSDYNSSPKLKFDGTDDYIILKLNERPGVLTFDIKGNSFSGGTFTVQTSVDGTTYTDLETYTEINNTYTQSEVFNNLGANVRYIKWIYTTKYLGNVALGNIKLAQYKEPQNYTVNWTAGAHTELFVFAGDESETIENGDEVAEGTTVMVSVGITDEGFELGSLTVKDADNNEVELTELEEGSYYSFEMPESNVTITSTATEVVPPTPGSGDQYALYTGELVEGDYIIYYEGYAMNYTVDSGRLQYAEVTPVNNLITTDNDAIVWHIAPSGEYWTIYSADAKAYAAGTGVKNKAQMLADATDDKALWSVTGTETYEFVNKANAAAEVNANLRNNGTYGFACYATSTGGALSLYKKVEQPCVPATITLNGSGYATFASTSAVDFATANGYTAWAITVVSGTEITFSQITGAVAAGTGVLLKGTAGASISPVYTTSGETLTTNKLEGFVAATVINSGEYYGLSGDKFVKVNGGTVPAGKALLPASVVNGTSSGVNAFTFNFDEDATAIKTIDNGQQTTEDVIYNVAGQRLNKMQKGINIVNGKKILK